MTVSQLAARCSLSRSTLLYYESIGLLQPASRSASNYRRYSDADLRRLEQIRAYRDAGLSLGDVQALMMKSPGPRTAASDLTGTILQRRFLEIDKEVSVLRRQQQAILSLLQDPQTQTSHRRRIMTKDKWVSIMRATGFTDDEMNRWHVEFERSAPDDHQQFLEFLQIGPEEIAHIREWSQNSGVSKR